VATPNRSAAFSTILSQIVTRLNVVLGRYAGTDAIPVGDTYVRVVIAPSPDFAPYRAERGVHLVVYPPEPRVPGGGRYATLVQRELVIHVVTESLLDQAGVDGIAAATHLDTEDTVVVAVLYFLPPVLAATAPVPTPGPGTAVNVRWKGGAQQQHRMTQIDHGLVYSAVAFEISYAHPFTVPTPA